MELLWTQEDERFRHEVRRVLESVVPPDMARRTRRGFHSTKADLQHWNRILFDQGWVAPHWPREHGGTGWSPLQIHIFEEECARADAPFLSYFGLRLIGPLLYTFGTPEQKQRYLPGILTGETFWCQGFSEPGSGSDLASVRTTATRDGDGYVVNGQKTWTTEAHYADKMFCLVRTDPAVKPQRGGLSMLMFDMDQPGITVRPIRTIDEGHSVNEVFLDNVRVPLEDRLGDEGEGWNQAKFLLGNERVTNAQVPRSKRDLDLLRQWALAPLPDGERLLDRPDLRQRLAGIEIDLAALEWSVLRILYSPDGGRTAAAASGLKITGSEIQQRLTDLAYDMLGPRGIPFYPEPDTDTDPGHGDGDAPRPGDADAQTVGVAARQLFLRAASIYAGTNEIQRSIIAKQMFGL